MLKAVVAATVRAAEPSFAFGGDRRIRSASLVLLLSNSRVAARHVWNSP